VLRLVHRLGTYGRAGTIYRGNSNTAGGVPKQGLNSDFFERVSSASDTHCLYSETRAIRVCHIGSPQ